MHLDLIDKMIAFFLGFAFLVGGYFLYNKEKRKPNVNLNLFFGYKFFKHYGIILMFFGVFLLFIAIHSMIYR
jgi:hypothetical protein